MAKVKITDTILRDAHQSLIATRMKTEDMLPILEKLDKVGFYSLECWGGATFDSCLRFLKEDPWERLRTIRKHVKNTKLQMLLRGQNILGYRHYADDVVEYFVQKAIANGIDIIRIFDALNDPRNLKTAIDATNKEGGHAQIAISYTLSEVHTLEYYTKLAKQLEEMGADSICIKDMAGLLVPYEATRLVKALKETVKELVIDEYGNKVYGVYKGKFGTINDVQRSLSLLNVYSLESNGWYNYQTGKVLDISANDIEYFNEGRQISLDYAKRYLNSDNYEVYVVTSNDYGYEKVEKVTFRNGRDSVLDYSTISYTNGLDYIKLLNNSKNVGIDEGTIVIKNGKLVESSSVMAPDYVQVILNGSNAAIVNVEQEPNNDALSIFRGRIAKIDEYQSFQVQSHAVLKDMEWIYSPIPRIFNLSYNTKIYDENGIIPFDEFISYTDISKVDEVYTIIAEGTTANVIVKNPYAKEGVKGQIVDINDTEIMLKDVLSYSSDDEKWSELSYRNNYAIMNVIENSIVIKNNNIVDLEDIRIGDTIKVLTTEVLAEKFQETGDRSFDGYIIFVEN